MRILVRAMLSVLAVATLLLPPASPAQADQIPSTQGSVEVYTLVDAFLASMQGRGLLVRTYSDGFTPDQEIYAAPTGAYTSQGLGQTVRCRAPRQGSQVCYTRENGDRKWARESREPGPTLHLLPRTAATTLLNAAVAPGPGQPQFEELRLFKSATPEGVVLRYGGPLAGQPDSFVYYLFESTPSAFTLGIESVTEGDILEMTTLVMFETVPTRTIAFPSPAQVLR